VRRQSAVRKANLTLFGNLFCKRLRRLLPHRHRHRREGRRKTVYVTYPPEGTPIIMANPANIPVPLASTGLVARAKFELDMQFGDKEPTDADETVTYGTGGKFSHVVNKDGTVNFTAVSTTIGDSDTAIVNDQNETVEVTLTVTADTAIGEEYEGVTYVQTTAAPGTVGTETSNS